MKAVTLTALMVIGASLVGCDYVHFGEEKKEQAATDKDLTPRLRLKISGLVMRFPLWIALTAVLLGCSGVVVERPERLYSYREVGMCNGRYVGESHTPGRRITDCMLLLTTALELNVSFQAQTVTFIETAFPYNTGDDEWKYFGVHRLSGCNVVSRYSFNCQEFGRRSGAFVNTEILRERRISDSWTAVIVAKFGDGWIDESLLHFCESSVLSVAVWVLAACIWVFSMYWFSDYRKLVART